jgi:hypothetical protein
MKKIRNPWGRISQKALKKIKENRNIDQQIEEDFFFLSCATS